MVLQKVFTNWTSSEGLQYVIVQCPLKEGDIHKGVMTPDAPEAINGTVYKKWPPASLCSTFVAGAHADWHDSECGCEWRRAWT